MTSRLLLAALMIAVLIGCSEASYTKSLKFPEGISEDEKVVLASRVVPSEKQLRWQSMELTAFLHFGINTFTGNEWGNGKDSPELFNPSGLDCRQWVKELKDAGFKMAILTAKHHDGFCLWQTETTDYSVRNSPWRDGKGDVVQELSEACREYGIEFGIYLSPWDRNAPCYGDSPAYNAFFISQLSELLTNYGRISEVWFDGACAEGSNGRKQVYDWPAILNTIHELQPDAVTAIMGDDVRWVGNEGGVGRETEWSVTALVPESYERSSMQNGQLCINGMSKDLGSRELLAKAEEVFWYPSEVDVSIRPGWFYHPYQDSQVRSLENLVDIYYKSVGRNSVLLLNIPPDTRGLIHEIDACRIKDLRRYIDETFKVNNIRRGANRIWLIDSGESREFAVRKGALFNTLLICEDISRGQRVESFSLEVLYDKKWVKVAEGTTIGYKRLLRFPDTSSDRIRLTIDSARGKAVISEIGLYYAPEVAAIREIERVGDVETSLWTSVIGGAGAAYDGNLSTEWTSDGLVSFVVDMREEKDFSGFVYAPGNDEDLSGTIFRYEFLTSSDGKEWTTVVADGEFSNIMNNPVPFTVSFKKRCRARYFALKPLEEISGKKLTSIGEIGIIETDIK